MILITRQLSESKKIANELALKLIPTIIEPMLKINYIPTDLHKYILQDELQCFLTTSKNARKFVPPGQNLVSIPEHGETAAEVFNYIKNNLSPDRGKIVYLRGASVSFDFETELGALGYEYSEEVVYIAAPPDEFSENFIKNLPNIKLATFFSSQTYRNFVWLARKYDLLQKFGHVEALFISQKIVENNPGISWKKINVAKTPNQNSIMAEIYKFAA